MSSIRMLERASRALAAGALAAACALPAPAVAQSAPEPWEYRAQIYLWFPSIDGETRFPPSSGGTVGATVNASDYLSALQFAFMGTFEARKGRWGVLTDVIYLSFEKDKSGTRDLTLTGPGGALEIPVGASADATLKLSGWQWGLAGTYTAIRKPGYELQVLGGFRYLKIDTSIDWNLSGNVGQLPPAAVSGRLETNPGYWDAVVGVRGRANLGQSAWFIPYYVDIGTGQSDLTWQAVAGLGYAFRWGEVTAAYRYLDYDFPSGDAMQSLSFGGPAVSVAFRW